MGLQSVKVCAVDKAASALAVTNWVKRIVTVVVLFAMQRCNKGVVDEELRKTA
jgi:hypothetical protein